LALSVRTNEISFLGTPEVCVIKVLQALELAERCFLSEILHWLAFRRLPISEYTLDGEDARFFGDKSPASFDDVVTDTECTLAGLPPNPEYEALLAERWFHDLDFYETMLALNLEETELNKLRQERAEAVEFHNNVAVWQASCDAYLEYFKARIFVDLREGKIQGSAVEVPGNDGSEASEYIYAEDIPLSKQPIVQIPPEIWIASNIDWENSALVANSSVFHRVHFLTEAMIAAYPIPSSTVIGKVVLVGDLYILDAPDDAELTMPSRRGRPPLPWDRFHLEAAALVKADTLPRKKEAAIHQFAEWFRHEFGISVGRSSIGQKLTPYYDRFVHSKSENSPG
jgi:hypothetical protein